MKQLEAWLLDIELVVKTAKTCAMLFHSSGRKYVDKPSIMYNNTVIAYSPNIKWKSLNGSYFMIESWKEATSHQSKFCIIHIISLIWSTVLYFGSQTVIIKKFFVFKNRWYIWFLGLKDMHPAGIVLRHIRL